MACLAFANAGHPTVFSKIPSLFGYHAVSVADQPGTLLHEGQQLRILSTLSHHRLGIYPPERGHLTRSDQGRISESKGIFKTYPTLILEMEALPPYRGGGVLLQSSQA